MSLLKPVGLFVYYSSKLIIHCLGSVILLNSIMFWSGFYLMVGEPSSHLQMNLMIRFMVFWGFILDLLAVIYFIYLAKLLFVNNFLEKIIEWRLQKVTIVEQEKSKLDIE